jgi:uncharacterized Rossmann fold enzyme
VVCFHGRPKPWECDEEWIRRTYRVGGDTAGEVQTILNTTMDTLWDNVRQNCETARVRVRERQAHRRHLVIFGGGPSAEQTVGHLDSQADVWALNGAARWLVEHDVSPDYHVIMDARPENESMLIGGVRRMFASQCWSGMVDENTLLWHADIGDDMRQKLPPRCRNDVLIRGGATVLTRALVLAAFLGYRRIELHGVDSSLSNDRHHVYDQPQNDKDPVIEARVDDKIFLTTAWMAAQVNDFQTVSATLANDFGCEIYVRGSGLLPYVAKRMMAQGMAA